MYKILSLIWFWSLVAGSEIKLNLFTWNTENNSGYVVNEATVFATSASNIKKYEFLAQIDSVKTCTDCHDDLLNDETVHAPARKDCKRCHVSNGVEHPQDNPDIIGFTLKKEVPGLCYECHAPMNVEEFVHAPAQKGKCITCHNPHSSPNLYLVKENPVSKLCYECHDLKIPKGNLIHGAVSDGNCQGCHNPHQADNKSFIANTKLDRLCKKCHKSIRKELKKKSVHAPFKKKACFDCHNPHSSKEANLSDLKPQELCFSCHEDTHNTIKNAKLVHQAVNKTKACLNCHSPHSSTEKFNLLDKEKELCLSCHNKTIASDTGSIQAIGPLLKEGNTVHKVIDEEGCTVCHKPHESDQNSLLNKAFPAKEYVKATPANFELCFSCHNKQLFANPITETATNFRDGDQNLHYTHIKGDKGRSCTLCHDPHGSVNNYMIKEKTQFGNWQMPIDFKLLKNGGSCLTGCHVERSYERIIATDTLGIVVSDTLNIKE